MDTNIKYYALKLENKSPMHISQNNEVFVEKKISRNSNLNMRGRIPATAMAGAFRRWCLENNKDQFILGFFGTKEEKVKIGYEGVTWIVEDGYSQWIDREEMIINRYYKPISSSTRTFDRKCGQTKFMIKSNTKFELNMELKFVNVDERLINNIQNCLEQFIEAIKDGEIYLGSNAKDGMGQLLLTARAEQSFDMKNDLDVQKYMDKIPENWDYEIFKSQNEEIFSMPNVLTSGYKFQINFPYGLKVSKDQLPFVENKPENQSENKIENKIENKEYIIYASTQRGFLKSYFEKMSILFNISDTDILSNKAMDILFGSEQNEAKLKLKDIYIKENTIETISRCKLNDLTLEPMLNSYFEDFILKTEDLIDWYIDLSKLTRAEWLIVEPYFLCLIMDLVDGKCSWGGGITNGYGVINVETINKIVEGEYKIINKSSNSSNENNGGAEYENH